MASSKSEILNQFTLDEVVEWLNARQIGNWFVCYNCGKLVRGDPLDLDTTDYGDQQCFCMDCARHCPGCDYDYAPSMESYHDDCEKDE